MSAKFNRRHFIVGGTAAVAMPFLARSKPAIGFKEFNALYQRELPIWIEVGKALGPPPA